MVFGIFHFAYIVKTLLKFNWCFSFVQSLCNACGIRYKKEERRAAAAAAVSPVLDCTSGYISGYSYQSSHQQQNWGCYASTVGKSTGFSSYGDDTSDSHDLPWQRNIVQPQLFRVVDRAGLYQYN
jgi:hypothetical protein